MSGMLELGSSRCLNLTAEFKFKKNRFKPSKWRRLFTFEFQFEFWGVLPALFYPYGAFLSHSIQPLHTSERAFIIELQVQNLKRLYACSSDN